MTIEYIFKWFEHFFILPIRWFKIHCQVWCKQQQRCKVCGYRDKFDFYVPDEIWKIVVPSKYQDRVVCLACFDDFAKKKEVDCTASIKKLYFAGNIISLSFKAIP